MIKWIKKNYKIMNILMLCLCIYAFFLPIISKILEKILPGLTRCPFLMITGKPCPLCGGTRFIEGLPNVFKDITYIFNFFGIVIIIILIEFIFRIINLCKKEHSDKLMNIDIIIHIILVCTFFLYEIIYTIKIM